MDDDDLPNGEDIPEALMEIADWCQQLIEGVAGYRASCEAAGFSPMASEEMAVDYHRYFLSRIS